MCCLEAKNLKTLLGLTWALIFGALYFLDDLRFSDCRKWGSQKTWGGDVRCGFSPAVKAVEKGIGEISLRFGEKLRTGTVFLVSPDIALTAAHLLRDSVSGLYQNPEELVFNDDLGGIRRMSVEAFEVGPFKKTISRARGDWAVLKIAPLDSHPLISIGEVCKGGKLRIAGYAGLSRPRESECKLVDISAYPYDRNQVIWSSCDAVNGMSGGPIFQQSHSGVLTAVGVLSLELDRKPPWSFGPAVTDLLRAAIENLSDYPPPQFERCDDFGSHS